MIAGSPGSPYDVGERPVILIEVDAAKLAGEWNAHLHAPRGDADDHILRLAVGVLKREGHRHVEHVLAELFELQHNRLSFDAIAKLELRQRGPVDPALEEALERKARFGFHRRAKILGADLSKARHAVKAPQPAEERVVADEPAQHVEDGCTFVVDECAEHTRLAANVSEAIAEIH